MKSVVGFSGALVLFVSLAAIQLPVHAQCLTSVYSEGFEAGTLPVGWSASGQWGIASQSPCGPMCKDGFFAYFGWNSGCDCGSSLYPCTGGSLETPAISLPSISSGQKILVDFCFDGYLDGFCNNDISSCTTFKIESATTTTTYVLGAHFFSWCPGPFTSPPYDITEFAGQVVLMSWTTGCIDEEGNINIRIDDVRVEHILLAGTDCNGNMYPDLCDIQNGTSQDCNANVVPDECDIGSGVSPDCNANGTPDECDVASGLEADCDSDSILDSCAIAAGIVPDCNQNAVPDGCDISLATSNDFDANGIPDECQCKNTHLYCVGGVNSTGKTAKIGYQGSTSITLNHLSLTVQDGRPNQIGIFFYGAFKTQTPFGDGFLCTTGSLTRIPAPVLMDSLGAGVYAVDFQDSSLPVSHIQALSEWNFQFWYRDPQTLGNGFNLSDALHLHFCP